MLHVLDGKESRLVERHTKMGKEAVEEVQDVKADTRLRSSRFQYPVGVKIFVSPRAVLHGDAVRRRGTVLVKTIVLVTDTRVAVCRRTPYVVSLSIGSGGIDIVASRGNLRENERIAVRVRACALLYGTACPVVCVAGILIARGGIRKAKSLRFYRLVDANVRRLNDTRAIIGRLALGAVHVIRHRHVRVTLYVYLYVTNLLTNNDLVFHGYIATVEIADEVRERLRACVDVHRQTFINLLIVRHDERTTTEGQTIGVYARRQVLQIDGADCGVHIVDVLYEPTVAVNRNVERIREHLHIVEDRILVFYVDREVILQDDWLVIDEYRKMGVHSLRGPRVEES